MKFVVVLALVAAATATIVYERTQAPAGWTQLENASPAHPLTIHFALPQRNIDQLTALTLASSDPRNEAYGDFLTHEQIMALIGTDEATVAEVAQWIESQPVAGLEAVENLGDALRVRCTAAFAARLLDTKFAVFRHDNGRRVVRQVGAYSVPDQLAASIELITGVADFPPQHEMKHWRSVEAHRAAVDAGANNACNTPPTIRKLYNVSDDMGVSEQSVSQGPFAQWPGGEEGFGESGLKQWVKLNNLPDYVSNVSIFGDKAASYTPQSTGDVEAQLDMQMGSGIANGAQQWFAIEEGWMYEFAVTVFGEGSDAPLTISMSYGWPEENQCEKNVLGDNCKGDGIPGWRSYLVRAENEWMKITATGRTIIASSGDTGAPGDNNDCSLQQKYPLHPSYPATGTWLLSVGGTTLKDTSSAEPLMSADDEPAVCKVRGCTCSTSTQEIPCTESNSGYTSGGGFSLVIPQPSWQQSAVAAYVQSGAKMPNSDLFNSSNRAFPDVTGIGANVLLVGPDGFVGGTSASCPLWSGLVSMLNDMRAKAGLKPMGHIAPLLYQLGEANHELFNDISTGCNDCTESGCCQGLGYCATTGFDPVVGLGSPNFGKLADAIMNMDYSRYRNIRL